MSVVPDTSIWVGYLRAGGSGGEGLDELLMSGRVVVCGPVVAELLAGTASGRRAELWGLLSGLPWAPLGPEEWRRVGEIAAALRERGASVPLTDIEIGVAAAGAGALLWSRDSDFARIGSVLPELERFSP